MAEKTAFAQTLRKLRENKKISQKKASQDLGISQALLSHYEKGVRECGLHFLIKVSKYYGVTADYLLGLNSDLNVGDEKYTNKADNSGEAEIKSRVKNGNNYSVLYKKLLANTIVRIFDCLKDEEYKQTAKIAGEYMLLSAYAVYKHLFDNSSDEKKEESGRSENTEELTAAQAKLVVGMKKDKLCAKCTPNEYISHMIKNSESIISKI